MLSGRSICIPNECQCLHTISRIESEEYPGHRRHTRGIGNISGISETYLEHQKHLIVNGTHVFDDMFILPGHPSLCQKRPAYDNIGLAHVIILLLHCIDSAKRDQLMTILGLPMSSSSYYIVSTLPKET